MASTEAATSPPVTSSGARGRMPAIGDLVRLKTFDGNGSNLGFSPTATSALTIVFDGYVILLGFDDRFMRAPGSIVPLRVLPIDVEALNYRRVEVYEREEGYKIVGFREHDGDTIEVLSALRDATG